MQFVSQDKQVNIFRFPPVSRSNLKVLYVEETSVTVTFLNIAMAKVKL